MVRGTLILTWAAVMAAPLAFAESKSVESELRQLTQANLDAIAPGDVSVWRRTLHPDFLHIDEEGKVRNKSEFLAVLTPLPAGLTGTLEIADFRVVLVGNTAIATHEDEEHLDYFGQMLESRWRTTDTWVRTPDGWRLAAEQVLALQVDPPAISMRHTALCEYNGTYALTEQISGDVTCTDEGLQFKRGNRAAVLYRPEATDVFFVPGQPRIRRIFQRNEQGRIVGFVDRREGHDIRWKKTG